MFGDTQGEDNIVEQLCYSLFFLYEAQDQTPIEELRARAEHSVKISQTLILLEEIVKAHPYFITRQS